MVVSALVLTLEPEPIVRALTLARLASDPRLTLGELVHARLPVVAEAGSAADGAALVESLGTTVGVISVDVVAIDFDEGE